LRDARKRTQERACTHACTRTCMHAGICLRAESATHTRMTEQRFETHLKPSLVLTRGPKEPLCTLKACAAVEPRDAVPRVVHAEARRL
jgi:hypothetical protein